MSKERSSRADEWALSGVMFAAVMLFVIGLFSAFAGLGAIVDGDFYETTRNYAFDLDVAAWGWVHLVLGVVMIATGYALFRARPWSVIVAIVLVSLSAVANFLFIPYYPFWSIVLVALDVFVIWSLTRPVATQA